MITLHILAMQWSIAVTNRFMRNSNCEFEKTLVRIFFRMKREIIEIAIRLGSVAFLSIYS